MKCLTAIASCVAFALAVSPTAASPGVGGAWRISGQVADRPFVLDCRFEPRGAGFGGVCVEVSAGGGARAQPGKVHAVSNGVTTGGQVRWSFPVSAMLMKVDLAFAGSLDNNQMSGAVTAAGRRGAFTAMRE